MAADSRLNPTAAAGFEAGAVNYERARPGYPPEVLEILERELRLSPGCQLCDLAAGTGKLTRLLVGGGWDVVAIEPVAGMRAQLAAVLPGVEVLDGTAEAIPLPDGSIDGVTVAQAFHWFRFAEALAEIRRVLRPGGGLAILFNRRDEREPWVAEMSKAIYWHQRTAARYQAIDWTDVLGSAGFGPVGQAAIEWAQPMTRDLLAARVRSNSYVAKASPKARQGYVDRVLALVDGLEESFDLPYVTDMWWARTDRN